jgi:hypothetical protein
VKPATRALALVRLPVSLPIASLSDSSHALRKMRRTRMVDALVMANLEESDGHPRPRTPRRRRSHWLAKHTLRVGSFIPCVLKCSYHPCRIAASEMLAASKSFAAGLLQTSTENGQHDMGEGQQMVCDTGSSLKSVSRWQMPECTRWLP